MPLAREGIENVRTVVQADAVGGDGRSAAFSRIALVRWRSSQQGRLHQVYVNGCLAGVTVDPAQRYLVVPTPSSFESAVHVEVVAVEPHEGHIDFAREIATAAPCNSRARLIFLRSQNLPSAAAVSVYFDNGTGSVDYGTSLNQTPIPVWPCWQDKAGFGMSRFGTGDFGYDAAAAVGFGKGSFGRGEFGLDSDTIEWISPILPLGEYRFGVKVVGDQGNESLASETTPMTVVPAAKPAVGLDIVTFDKQTNVLTFRIEDQA
jgi:hypothetical protein